MGITTQSTTEGQDAAKEVPRRTGDTVSPEETRGRKVPADVERDASAAGVAVRGAEAARQAVPDEPLGEPEWHGQEVADAPGHQAEAGADRAAARVPGYRHGEFLPDEAAEPAAMSPDEARQAQELKRQAAAEDHDTESREGSGAAPKDL